ncbi:hypothetical protein TWF970_003778 [Orbilia oligospora]|uniref:Uncharacterized protein n=1 Tax=Orbilia oligospora TaxID=2813651 RepID=A0A7C8V9A4_ORBOL|nr:hypothetical protein TWF970_003778 [Orbilia oligospora]
MCHPTTAHLSTRPYAAAGRLALLDVVEISWLWPVLLRPSAAREKKKRALELSMCIDSKPPFHPCKKSAVASYLHGFGSSDDDGMQLLEGADGNCISKNRFNSENFRV